MKKTEKMAPKKEMPEKKRKKQKKRQKEQSALPPVQQTYKDRLFRMIFREKKELLSLYNAVNHTHYTKEEDLEIVTLENAIYINMKNDLAFLLAFELNLYEHQSTPNPNMPLRDLFYVARELERLIDKEKLYGDVLIKIPTPRFVVFYNGTTNQPEQAELKLSDAFIRSDRKQGEQPELELKVTMLNINLGYNQELAEHCQTLKDYMLYVDYNVPYKVDTARKRDCLKVHYR